MKAGELSGYRSRATARSSDAELVDLFHREPEQAWRSFIDRYADVMLSCLERLGFDYDQAMDRFLFVCEKLVENDYRRLKTIRHLGPRGDLAPWVRQVVKNLAINWAWSVDGRRRLFKSVSRLPAREQRVFELYFWRGLSPAEICEELRKAGPEVTCTEVLDALEVVFSHLTQKQVWRLTVSLARQRRPTPLDDVESNGNGAGGLADGRDDPEQLAIRAEASDRLWRAVGGLSARERLLLQLRYEEALGLREIGEILRIEPEAVKSSLGRALRKLRAAMEARTPPADAVYQPATGRECCPPVV